MNRSTEGWFQCRIDRQPFGAEYGFVLPDQPPVPDPASRYQPSGVAAPSVLLDENSYRWQNLRWTGRPWEEAVTYELHLGTFTQEGTFRSAIPHLRRLAEIGFTAIELMPLAEFPGERGWGYDGVYQYAPHHAYGSPDDFKALVDAAHRHGMMVILDVVYNHFGPAGNYIKNYAPDFFLADDPTPWGPKIAFARDPVRRFFVDNVLYWLQEFRLDGLRLDAIDQIEDPSSSHILREMSETVRRQIPDRTVHLIVENPANGADLLASDESGAGLFTADWNDDFHHALHVAVTGEATGHYEPFKHDSWGKVRKTLAWGYLRQGRSMLGRPLPDSASLPPTSFVHFLQNHDQVGNRALGERLHAMIDRRCHSVLTELLLFSPQIPLMFMGDDHRSSKPFHFFAAYDGELADAIRRSRPKEALNFGGFPDGTGASDVPDPNESSTFLRCKLHWSEANEKANVSWAEWLCELISVRRQWIVPLLSNKARYSGTVLPSEDGAVFIDWKLAGSILSLRANASPRTYRLDLRPADMRYPGRGQTVAGVLEPWSTHLYIGDR
jgi:maltooligosyltrehalose trehalohydrolase